jgi:multiple sugar transport system substrate-binding protein
MGRSRYSRGRFGRSPAVRSTWAIVAIGALLAACSASGASARPATRGASHATVTLKFWNAYNNVTETPVLNKIVIPRFEKENPGIKVEDVNLPYNGLEQKFIAASAAGNPPDLMRSDIAWMPQLASQGTLLEVSKYPWFAPLKAAALAGPLSTTAYKGSYYGLPDDTNTQVLFWNKSDFAAAGISGPPTTLNELYQDAQKLTVPSKGQYGLGVDSTDIWNVGPYIWSTGGGFTNPALTSATNYIDGPGTYDALNHLVDLLKAGDIWSDFRGGAGAVGGETGFAAGTYAMLYDGPWGVGTYAKSKPKPNYGLAPLPTGAGGSASVVGGEDLAIAAGGKNLADTIKFAQYLSSPFAQIAMAKAGDMSVYKTDAAAEVKAKPFLKVFAQQLLTAKARPVTEAYSTLDSDFSAELQKVLAGKESLKNGLDAATKSANTALASR